MSNRPATTKANPSRMTVDQANALVAESNQESKESTEIAARNAYENAGRRYYGIEIRTEDAPPTQERSSL